jgi:hypothetical protein
MLSGQQFYYRTIRRNIVSFGTMFKDLQLVTYTNDDARTELKRVRVPLIYGDKEDYFIRLKAAKVFPLPTDLPLPRMMFRMTNFYYDASRKQQSQLQQFAASGIASGLNAQFVPVPYNMDFELQIYVRNTEDGCQIVEQIIPYFTPEYTLKMVFVDQLGITKNIPVVLTGINRSLENEGASDWTMRREVWSLTFTMQTYVFGPTQSGGLITKANTNLWYYTGTQASGQSLQLTLTGPGFHSFKLGEVAYQGPSLQQATAVGYVQGFDATKNLLSLYQQSGTFTVNANVKGAVTSASWNVATMPTTKALAIIEASIVPASANLGDDFGFSTVIVETPNT